MSSQDPSDSTRCAHCGLPVPPGLIEPSETHQFCCNGCRTVYAVIHGSGLDRFYRLRDSAEAEQTPALTTDRRYDEFDDPVFRGLYYETPPDGIQAVELYLEGVHCAACVWLVEKLPEVVPGVIESRLDMRRSLLRVRWDENQVKLSQVARMLDSLGYPPHPAKDAQARELRKQEDRKFLIRIGVAAACAGNVMTLSFALYGGAFTGIEAEYSNLFRLTSMVFGLVSLIWPGSLFFRGAWAALRTRTAHLDLPIALGLAAGGITGTVNAVLGRGEIYFDSLTMLVFLLLVGRWIQRRQQRSANDAVELLFSITPSSARRVEEDAVREVPVEALQPGDVVEIRAGDSVPTDGVVLDGVSSVDQSLLTGESVPGPVSSGDPVHAGTVNIRARLHVRVDAIGSNTRVGRLMQLVEDCSHRRAPIVQMADRLAGWFVMAVLGLAVMTLGLWLWLDPAQAVDNSVALLIVCCPCALGLSTPLAVAVALGRAAKRRILVKGGETLELLAQPSTVVLDKTGTITAGRAAVVQFFGDDRVKPLIAAIEHHSSHPIALAMIEAFEDEHASLHSTLTALDVQQTPGGGLVGRIDGKQVAVGSPAYVRSQSANINPTQLEAIRHVVRAGNTPVVASVDQQASAVIGIGDPIRDDAPRAIGDLRKLGYQVHILSGDHPDVVSKVAKRLGVPEAQARGAASPEQKVAYLENLMKNADTVMVGDGVNDAAALAAATVGIAVHGGAEASLASADVYLSRPGLTPIVELIRAARRTVRTIRLSLLASLCYNVVAAALAMAGIIGPLTAAVLMPISSFTVVTLALASRTFGDDS
jgi:Cu2+-exporting ATPase